MVGASGLAGISGTEARERESWAISGDPIVVVMRPRCWHWSLLKDGALLLELVKA